MAAAKKITDEHRAELARLHAAGMTRNDIAREMGISGATVSKLAADAGLTFDRTAVAAATKARQADLADRRSRLELKNLKVAEQLLDQINQPHLAFNFGGKDNTYTEKQLDRPPVRDVKDLVAAASIATTASLRIAALDTSNGVDEAKSMLVDLFSAMGTAWRDSNSDDPEEPE